jgi:hypothetical protein
LLSRNLRTEVKKRRVEGIQGVLREVYKTGKGVTSNISLNVNWKDSKVEVTTINGNKLDKLKKPVIDSILNILYADDIEKREIISFNDQGRQSHITYEHWGSIFEKFDAIMDLLRKPDCLTVPEFNHVCDLMDEFGNLYITMFNYARIGPYLHYIISGHVSDMLRYCNYNLANFQQQGAESFNRDCAVHFWRQTSGGGGVNAVHPALDTVICFGRRWYRAIKDFFPEIIEQQRNGVTKSDRLKFKINE